MKVISNLILSIDLNGIIYVLFNSLIFNQITHHEKYK